ncbi:uncharacterized protein LOC127260433 [Andrographis paniculata]|uniref:uncharacterized protein LOC127260433 n=1 Tax=Andrographis paniculata TaxID=175694 RepID=UPI0021E8B529|nr:uncharacterized protein LOC127260433 [Andrographis paniculata]
MDRKETSPPATRKRKWTEDEEDLLQDHAINNTNWNIISKEFPGRTMESCRGRWYENRHNWATIARFLPAPITGIGTAQSYNSCRYRPPLPASASMASSSSSLYHHGVKVLFPLTPGVKESSMKKNDGDAAMRDCWDGDGDDNDRTALTLKPPGTYPC